MKLRRNLRILALLLILSTAFIPLASAHKALVGYFAGVQAGEEMQIKAWYEGGGPMANAEVTVSLITGVDENGKDILKPFYEGQTDEAGFCTIATDRKETQYKIVVEQDGHRARGKVDLEAQGTITQESELPLPTRVVAGFGYLIGLAGLGMLLSARKTKKEYEKK
ncbi:MAG: hypothetical protein PHD41_05335 [Methanosarcinaceae archaeon]|nr:hypothetical protein [Methanosarcinaceae archaeon]MDD4331644.1 hypothetical protein [Methanosarcinaceae archaeon]MDD4749850.1 hypothetical protein [Methanosarcinaceae archaeon]